MSPPRVGYVGSDDRVEQALSVAGIDPVAVESADVVVARGERALRSLLPDPPAPVLPVEAGAGLESVTLDGLARALEMLAGDGPTRRRTHPLLTTTVAGERVHALFDVMLVTSEPARISEYSVHHRGEQVARFRADGVVVATPAGSTGYAAAVGGPRLAPELGVVCVVPVSPFAIGADHWVLSTERLELRVERDETPVECLVDDGRAGPVEPTTPVTIETDGLLETVHPRGLERL